MSGTSFSAGEGGGERWNDHVASRFLIKLLSSTGFRTLLLPLISFFRSYFPWTPRRDKVSEPLPSGSFIGSLKAGFVTERSELGSCRAFRFQYPILRLDGDSAYFCNCLVEFVGIRCLMVRCLVLTFCIKSLIASVTRGLPL